jgi:hypothetical protein
MICDIQLVSHYVHLLSYFSLTYVFYPCCVMMLHICNILSLSVLANNMMHDLVLCELLFV